MKKLSEETIKEIIDLYKNNYKTSEEDPNKNQENKYEPIYVFRK